ncbi:hypothetical protein [Streptomyces achromogenes]|uniref:hypothetical protein n=1 Tax=Streptomyces achromogenes TaxID=67255 RepID=UPI0004C859FB|nr:hypothetical protein [Streptomyces achromogenes]
MSTTGEVFQVIRGSGAALTALKSGSMVLGGKVCGCVTTAVRWAWDQASVDPEATAAAQAAAAKRARAKAAKAKKDAKAKAVKAESDEGDEDEAEEPEDQPTVTVPRVAPVRRPVPETLGMLAIAGMLATGALGTAVTLAWPHVVPYLQMLAPWRGVILTVGGLAWMAAAWMVAPPPAPAEAPAEEVDGQEVDELEAEDHGVDGDAEFAEEDPEEGEGPADEPAETMSVRLARHVLGELAALESAGKSAIHVTALIASAEKAEILAPQSLDKGGMRRWLEASGLPVTKSVKVGGTVDYGVRVDRVREALGMGPGEALARLLGGGARTAPPAPAETPVSTPVPAPAEAPLPAAAAPGTDRRLALVEPLPSGGSQGSAQGAA